MFAASPIYVVPALHRPAPADLDRRRDATDAADAAPAIDAADRPALWRRLLGRYARHPKHWADSQILFVVLAYAAALYAGLYHPYWARGGDSELYSTIARNLVLGRGYTYNGQPVGLVPPLWPTILAGAFWVTSVAGVLKLLMPAFFLVYLGCAYCVLRRLAGPLTCGATILLVASFQGLFVLMLWFHSDPPFLAMSWAALLLAVQAGERWRDAPRRRGPWLWRTVLAMALLAGAIATRWPGILWGPIVAVAFLGPRPLWTGSGDGDGKSVKLALRPRRLDAMWVAALTAGVVTFAVFFALRYALKVDPLTVDPRYDTFVVGNYDLVNQEDRPTLYTHLNRLLRAPEWVSVLYWNELGHSPGKVLGIPVALYFSRLAAVTMLPLLVAVAIGVIYRRQWLWVGGMAAWLPVVATWPHAIDRYSAPVAPLLVCGTILGTFQLSKILALAARRRSDRTVRLARLAPFALMAVPLGVIVLYNGSRYGLEVWAKSDYLTRYEGGVQPGLNRIGAYLRQNAAATGGEVAVSRLGFRGGEDDRARRIRVRGVRRNLVFVSDTPAVDVPAMESFDPLARGGTAEDWFVDFAARNRVRYFVLMPHHRRYFVHLRSMPWHEPGPVLSALNAMRSWLGLMPLLPKPNPLGDGREAYKLYELVGGEAGLPVSFEPIDVGEGLPGGVLVIPGLEDVRDLGEKRRWLPIPYN